MGINRQPPLNKVTSTSTMVASGASIPAESKAIDGWYPSVLK